MTRTVRSLATPTIHPADTSGVPGTLPRTLRACAAWGLLGLVPALALAGPATAQFTTYSDRTYLGVDDVEITPDGRYAVGRTTAADTRTFVIDLETGAVVLNLVGGGFPSCGTCTGPANDAVVLNNERAITLGWKVRVLDLTATPPVQIAAHEMGHQARDLAFSGDGRFAIVRGGFGALGGTYVLELATGTIVLFHPSDPPGVTNMLGNDMADAGEHHGITLSYDSATQMTGILVVEFDPPAGTGPTIVFDTNGMLDLQGRPMDVEVSPDGMHAVVRAEDEVALVRLDGTNTQIVRTFSNFPGATQPFGDTAFDTAVMTNDFWASITIGVPATAPGYLNVEDIAGTQWTALLNGTPRDLVVTPDGNKLLVHTGRRIYLFDLTDLPVGGGALFTANSRLFSADTSGVAAGLDSVVCTNKVAVVIAPTNGRTKMRLYDISSGITLTGMFTSEIEGSPVDVDITPDGAYFVVSSFNSYKVVDTRTLTTRMEVDSQTLGFFPWCDGVAIHSDQAAAFAVDAPHSANGWIDTIDLVSRETLSCRSLPNSTGEVAQLFALGSTRVNENDLEIHARSLPVGAPGFFFLGDAPQMLPFGGGLLCVGGNLIRLGVQVTTPEGTASEAIDIPLLPPIGGGLVPGSTWYTQFVYRDTPLAGGFNFSNASALLFE